MTDAGPFSAVIIICRFDGLLATASLSFRLFVELAIENNWLGRLFNCGLKAVFRVLTGRLSWPVWLL